MSNILDIGNKIIYGSFTGSDGNRQHFETEDAMLNPFLDVLEATYGALHWLRLSPNKDDTLMDHELEKGVK